MLPTLKTKFPKKVKNSNFIKFVAKIKDLLNGRRVVNSRFIFTFIEPFFTFLIFSNLIFKSSGTPEKQQAARYL